MSTAREEKVRAVFAGAHELPSSKRAAYLDSQCGNDAELRREVEELLEYADHDGGVLGEQHHGAGPEMLAEALATGSFTADAPVEKIDKYTILREIGHGGMGVVYEADQENPRRRVAIKVIRSAFVTEELLRRFHHESQVLGQLDHPGIAHIYEAGSTTIGDRARPFFAMEFVDGRPLDAHARESGLDHAEILELMARVADGVQHAHQKGIVHRDLKPANVLVKVEPSGTQPSTSTMSDRIGQPKVLDFGVARAIDPDLQLSTIQTMPGQLVGTLAYMSPEQIAGRSDLDERCDVYSLGVILYELLSRQRPFDLAGKPIAEAARIVASEDATDLGTLATELRGDITTIVSKAMEKEPRRRYSSAAELADDIRRFLRNEPIAARPPSKTYLLQKFARRNLALVIGAVATFMALTAGLVVSTAGFIQAREERDAKVEALEVSEAIKEFLIDMLQASDPNLGGKDVTVREILKVASEDVSITFADRPRLQAELHDAIGVTYTSLGEYAQADSQLSAAVEIWTRLAGAADKKTIESLSGLGAARYYAGQHELALTTFTEVLEGHRAIEPRDDEALLGSLSNVAFMRMNRGEFDQAEPMFREAREIAIDVLGPDDALTLDVSGNLAMLLNRMGRSSDAEALYRETIERSTETRGVTHPATVLLVANLASLYQGMGRISEAEPLYREALQSQRESLGENHSKTLVTLGNLAGLLGNAGRYDEAITMVDEGISRALEVHEEGDPGILHLRGALAVILRSKGDFDRALDVMKENLAQSRSSYGEAAYQTYNAWINLAELYTIRGEYAAARDESRNFVRAMIDVNGENHTWVHQARFGLADAYQGLGQYELAEEQLMTVQEIAGPERQKPVATKLVSLYEAWGRPEEAKRWRDMGK